MKKIFMSALCILVFAGLQAQVPAQFEELTEKQEVEIKKEANSNQFKAANWFRPSWDMLQDFYQGSANSTNLGQTMWPDSTVQILYDDGPGWPGIQSLGAIIDPYAGWYSQSIDPNTATNLSIDSVVLFGLYYNADGTFADTLVFEIVTGLPNEEPTFYPNIIIPGFPNTGDTARFCPPKMMGNTTQMGWEAKLTDPNKHVIKHVLTPDDSTAVLVSSKPIAIATGGISLAPGEVLAVNATYVPGYSYNFGDTIVDYANEVIHKNSMRFLVSDLSDDQANTFLDPYNDIGHYNGTYMINTDDRYGLHSDAWRNESMSIINPDYGLRVGAYIDWTEDVEEQEAITMDIYPNPAIDQINVSLEDHQDASFEIFNLLGEVVKSTQLTSQNTQVDVSGLSHGTYIVRVISGEKTATKKVIISH